LPLLLRFGWFTSHPLGKAKAADDAARLLKVLPNSKDLNLEHQDVPNPSPTSKPKVPEKRKLTAETGPSTIEKDESAVEVPSGFRLRAKGVVTLEEKGLTATATDLDVMIEEKGATAKTADMKASGLRLRCTGEVMIEGKGFTGRAAELQYDAERDFLMLSGGKTDCTLWGRNNVGKTSILKSEKIILHLQHGEIEMLTLEHH